MQAYDIFMLLILIAAVAWGFWKGFAWQLASLASIALSYFICLNFRTPVANFLATTAKAPPPWNIFLAMLLLFLGTSACVWISFNFISDLIERVRLKEFDRQVGAIFGFVKGVVLCVIVTLFAVTLLGEARCQMICNSRSGHYIAWLLMHAEAILPREVQQVLGPYVNPHGPNQPMGYTDYQQPPVPNYAGQPVYPQTPEQPVYPQYPDSAVPSGPEQYQPNTPYDPRYGQQPTYGSDATGGYQR